MKLSVSIAELKVMSEPRREERLSELVQSTRRLPNGEIEELTRRIDEFEAQHKMSSDDLIKKLERGEICETATICSWLMALRLRERLAALASPQAH